jgi:hypothetical protein
MSRFESPWYVQLLLAVPFFIIGVAGLKKAVNAYQIERGAARWGHTSGQLISAHADGLDVKVEYKYRVHGVLYVGRRLSLFGYGKKELAEKKARELVEHQRFAGKTVVFYDPAWPANSYLEVNTNYGVIGFFWSCCSIILGAALVRRAVRQSRPVTDVRG